ncbi:hypothetical protein BDW74DRAFT_149431 [Aspergillus multicolor]|uniref:uncharacterized protein n=1 Tax=Aspergillus multicolor TaxID=41759 RepID=UPI003CCD9B51
MPTESPREFQAMLRQVTQTVAHLSETDNLDGSPLSSASLLCSRLVRHRLGMLDDIPIPKPGQLASGNWEVNACFVMFILVINVRSTDTKGGKARRVFSPCFLLIRPWCPESHEHRNVREHIRRLPWRKLPT